ncbi:MULTISPECIES: porphobilinogen synthase [unclassified Granulicatella]|uniref:porphobilinogen synthase n=1 Tax=unclassified Granulicatella TaxID=2630493 RepID=UPI001073EE79|nr:MULTISPECIES: porphobilinogen synthase [unclassified Granulicatella]MBF0779533.1 porphobilinogen synthase [Granulicatella sp. 19428wC4_WM01]TFU96498.1 porphobilinogen synthase [Granulicatella sp. WM01]
MESFKRHRRLRQNAALRHLVRETTLSINDFIQPIFVKEGITDNQPISSMPGVYQLAYAHVLDEVKNIVHLGIKAIIVFGIPKDKDEVGTQASSQEGIVQRTIRHIKAHFPELIVIADTCLCEFTNHGHCGVLDGHHVCNDASLERLVDVAISQARAGADIIAPSNAMDGYVYAIRQGLNKAGFEYVPIMSYAVKFASSFYGPFRDAGESAPAFGDRKTYQMDPANRLEALREIESDVQEGADFVMVKPALAFLDIIREVKNTCLLPLVAYNVSGEYAMVKAAAQNGWIDEKSVVQELLMSMKRAGADLIITYFAKDMAKYLTEEGEK